MRSVHEICKKTGYKTTDIEFVWANCYVDFLYFAEHVIGFDISDYHREWYELYNKHKRLVIEAFRGSGKTYFFAALFVWEGIFNPGREFLVVSNTLEQAKIVLKVIRNMFADNEVLKQFMPDTRESSWKATELEIENKSSYLCKPYNENIRSIHPDRVLCDEAGEYDDKTIYHTAIMGTIQLKRGRMVVIGTPKSNIDLLAELMDNDAYYGKKYPAEVEGKAIWTQRYTMKPHDEFGKSSLVRIRKEMGDLPYTQEYMLIPISDANALFPYDLTSGAIDKEGTFLPFGRKGKRYYIGCDLAISQKGDYTVFTVIEADDSGKKVVKALRFRDSHAEQKRLLKQLVEDFKPIKILVDKTGLGEVFFRELQAEIYNVYPMHFTAQEKNKLLLDLRHEFEKKGLSIPSSKDDLKAYAYAQNLIKELNDFVVKVNIGGRTLTRFASGEYDDAVISLALANRASLQSYGTASIRSI